MSLASAAAYQAAADALVAIIGKLGQFRGEPVHHQAEWGDLFAALRRAVDTELNPAPA